MTIFDKSWLRAVLPQNASIKEAINNLDQTGMKIVLIVNDNNQLEGTVSDGDIRRSLLKGMELTSAITNITHHNALVVPPEMNSDMVMQLMVANKIHQIPVVDENRRLLGMHLWDEIVVPSEHSNSMVIMVGGKGNRLMPHTKNCPKALLTIAGKPMLEHIIERAKHEGFKYFILAINYLGHMIEDYFGNGDRLGVKIDYLREELPLGTAGALSLIGSRPSTPFLVTNGDVITDIRYGEFLDFHNRNLAAGTMAVRIHEWQNPYGVVKMRGLDIIGFEEKPITRNYINTGVYALSPEVLDELIPGTFCDMPMLFERLKEKNKHIVAYPIHEPWLDVGRPIDLQEANSSFGIDQKLK